MKSQSSATPLEWKERLVLALQENEEPREFPWFTKTEFGDSFDLVAWETFEARKARVEGAYKRLRKDGTIRWVTAVIKGGLSEVLVFGSWWDSHEGRDYRNKHEYHE